MTTGQARRLVLMRHAKSGWPDETADHERPLSARGARDAVAAGAWLRDNDMRPDLALVSTAVRARSTWELAEAALDPAPPVTHDARIYDATAQRLLAVVAETPHDVCTLVLVGHQPAMTMLASALAGDGSDADALTALRAKYPTSGLAVLEVPGDWAWLEGGSAVLAAFAVPRG